MPNEEDHELAVTSDSPAKTPAKKKRQKPKRKYLLLGLAAFFIIIGAVVFLYWLLIGQFYESTDDAYVAGNLVEVMSQVTGNVTQILSDETDFVKKGEPLIVLDKADAQVALQKAESDLAITVRNISQLYDNVNQLKADVALQQENYQKARDDYTRRQGLQVKQVISEEELEHAKIAADAAADTLTATQNKLNQALDVVGKTDLYHHPQIELAAASLRNAYLNMERTTIFAPATGYLAKRPVEVGQQVTPNTVLMVIVPLNEIWVEANFKESQLGYMRMGQPAELISDVYGSKVRFKGTVLGLGAGTGSSFDLLPPQNATGNWIKIVQRVPVRVSIDPQQLEKYPLQIGLSMAVTVDIHHHNGAKLATVPQTKVVYETQNYGSNTDPANKLIQQIMESNAKNVAAPTAE